MRYSRATSSTSGACLLRYRPIERIMTPVPPGMTDGDQEFLPVIWHGYDHCTDAVWREVLLPAEHFRILVTSCWACRALDRDRFSSMTTHI